MPGDGNQEQALKGMAAISAREAQLKRNKQMAQTGALVRQTTIKEGKEVTIEQGKTPLGETYKKEIDPTK